MDNAYPKWATPQEWLASRIERESDIDLRLMVARLLGDSRVLTQVSADALRRAVTETVTEMPAEEIMDLWFDDMTADGYFGAPSAAARPCAECGFDMGEGYVHCGAAEDGQCPECGSYEMDEEEVRDV